MPRTILVEPDRRLHQKSAPVADPASLDPEVLTDLFVLMTAHEGGVGLSAPQIGELLRVFVLDAATSPEAQVFINPSLISGKKLRWVHEGCLSVPGKRVPKRRFLEVEVEAFDETGARFRVMLRDVAAVAAQHELDHLNGRLISD